MSQTAYDQGYEDGRVSRQSEIDNWRASYATARADLAAERDERLRYQRMAFAPGPKGSDEVPF